jgi:hypothetical protein
MLEHGSSDARRFLTQLERARVVARCPCACASVDFAVDGLPIPSGGLRVLGDFLYGAAGELRGAFIFEQSGVLAGIEVWGLDVPNPATLPSPGELRPHEEGAISEAE